MREEEAFQTFDRPPPFQAWLGTRLIGQIVVDLDNDVRTANKTSQPKQPYGHSHAWTKHSRHLHTDAKTAKKIRTINDDLTTVSCHHLQRSRDRSSRCFSVS